MKIIHVISKNERDRRLLERIFKNIGQKAVFSIDLNDALLIFEKVNPAAVFIVDREDLLTEIKIREIKRVAPFIPIVVLLKGRDANLAVEYMKTGAFDCVQFPWTEEEIAPAVRKSLSLSGTKIELETPDSERQRKLALYSALLLTLVFGFIIGWYYAYSKTRVSKEEKNYRELPYRHPSGIIYPKDKLIISDWYTQALYNHNPKTFEISAVKSFANLMPTSLAQSKNHFWMLKTNGEIEKRLLDSKFTLLSRTKIKEDRIVGICFDGLYFWSSSPNEIRKHLNNDKLKILEKYKYSGGEISAMTCDNRFIWVADGKTKDHKKISLEIPGKIIESRFVRQYHIKGLKITGMVKKKAKIYFVGEKTGCGILFTQNEND